MQQHLKNSDISPEEIPQGFTAGNGPATEQQNESQKRELQRRAILEQALTPEALSRLGTIRVSLLSLDVLSLNSDASWYQFEVSSSLLIAGETRKGICSGKQYHFDGNVG